MMSNPLTMWTVYFGAGLLLTLAIALMPKRAKVWLGRFLPPNWASVAHVPLGWIGYVLYLDGYFLGACLVMGLSGGLDKFDGMAARAYDELVGTPLMSEDFRTQMSHRGTTTLGKILDPLADKLTAGPIYLHVGASILATGLTLRGSEQESYLLYLAVGLIALMLVADAFGQVIRMERFKRWHARADKSATHVGKVKSAAQWVWLGLYAVWHQGWLEEPEVYLLVLDFLLAIMFALAATSASSKIKPLREIWNGQTLTE